MAGLSDVGRRTGEPEENAKLLQAVDPQRAAVEALLGQ
jgi:hypothetical protein